jgi:hypothetical protein
MDTSFFRSAVETARFILKWYSRISPGEEQPDHEADHSSVSNAEV